PTRRRRGRARAHGRRARVPHPLQRARGSNAHRAQGGAACGALLPLQGGARRAFSRPAVPLSRREGPHRPRRARGRLLVRPHHRVSRRAARRGADSRLRSRSRLRGDGQDEGGGDAARQGERGQAPVQRGDAPAAVGGRRLRSGASGRHRRALAATPSTRPGGRVLPRAGGGRPHRDPRHAESLVSARDALGRPAVRAMAAAETGVPLRPRVPALLVRRDAVRGLRRRWLRLAERDARRLLAFVGSAWPRGPDRGRWLRLALLSRHRAVADSANALAALQRGRRAPAKAGPAAFAVSAVLESAPPQISRRDAGRVSVPAVSVLMPVRNGVPWVREAVTSVLAQTAGDLELIVIDDGSTDATPEVLADLRDPRLRLERRPSAGLTRALVRALEL